jgi:hypothetical protein
MIAQILNKIFIIETFVRDVQIIQKFKIIHIFGSSYEWKMYYWLHLNFVRAGKLCELLLLKFSWFTSNYVSKLF